MEIVLSDGSVCHVDEEDYEFISSHYWSPLRDRRDVVYAQGKVTIDGIKKTRMMHRVIMDAPDHLFVDHIDGDGLNNKKSNLRLCTRSQNLANSGSYVKNKKSKYKGVRFLSDRKTDRAKKWSAWINKDKKVHYLGCFKTEVEAALAYDEKAVELFGKFARPNFGPEGLYGNI